MDERISPDTVAGMIHHIRRAFIVSTLSVLIVAVLWSVLWSLAASQYKHVIDGWIDAGRANGYRIAYGERKLFGFPRHIILRFENVEWQNDMNILFHADDIDIAATPWRWQVFDAKFKNHVQITAPIEGENYSLILGGRDGRAHVELDTQGFWREARISLSKAEFGRAPDYLIRTDEMHVTGRRPEEEPQGHKEPGLTLSGEAEGVTLPQSLASPFGAKMAQLGVDLRVMGAVPDFRRKDSVDAWNKESGVVEFDRLHVEWGPLLLTARGTMGFDDDLQPEGAFAISLTNQKEVLKSLMDAGFIAQRQQAMLDSALDLFSKPSRFNHEGGDGINLPVAVQLGGLFLGPVRIFQYPPIEWPVPTSVTFAPNPPPPPSETPNILPPH